MVVGVSWITSCQECCRAVFWGCYCSSCTPRSFLPFWKKADRFTDDSTLMGVVPSPGVKVTLAEFLIRDIGKVSNVVWPLGNEIECEWDEDYDSLQVTHNASPVIPINYWWNCAEGVWWPLYIGTNLDWHLIPRWPLRHICARFPEPLLKDFVSLGSPGQYSMIDRFLGDQAIPVERSCSPCIRVGGLVGFKSRANDFLTLFVFYYFSLSLLSLYRLVLWGWGLWTDTV